MKPFALLIFVIIISCSTAFSQGKAPLQQGSSPELILASEIIFVNENPGDNIAWEEFIRAEAGYPENVSIELRASRSSKALDHYHFDLYKDNIRIFGASVHVAQEKNGKVKLIQAPRLFQNYETGAPAEGAASTIAQNALSAQKVEESEQVWVKSEGEKFTVATRVVLSGPETLHREVIVKNGEVAYETDLLEYYRHAQGPDDTAVSVHVFDPDPLTTAKVNYGGQYIDNNDQNSLALHNERKQRSTTLTYKDGGFNAENDHVKITEFSGPVTSNLIATSVTDNFDYSRDMDEFEDLNVIFHITRHAQHLAKLGYANLPGYQIEVDAHALSGLDQSFFSTTYHPFRLYFGEGGVDDAEDADVILHEFSHAVIHKAAPSTAKTTQRKCIEEALCDYFAVSYSRTVNDFNRHDVFNWDGHNEFFMGRKANSNKDYKQINFNGNNYYQHIDVMASPLLDIYDQLGRDVTDQLVLEAIFNLSSNTTMPQMAYFVLMSDSLLNQGANYNAIVRAFRKRGLMSLPISIAENHSEVEISLLNTYGFARGESLKLHSEERLDSYELYDMSGRKLRTGLIGDKEFSLSSAGLMPGVYILHVTTRKGTSFSFKLSRATY